MAVLGELFRRWSYQVFAPGVLLREKYNAFKELIAHDDAALRSLAELEAQAQGLVRADWARVEATYQRLRANVAALVEDLGRIDPVRYQDLGEYFRKIDFYVRLKLDLPPQDQGPPFVISLAEAVDRPQLAGGKAANLARVARETGVKVPPGVVVTANAFHYVLEVGELRQELDGLLAQVNVDDPDTLAFLCQRMQSLVLGCELPPAVAEAVQAASASLVSAGQRLAVRSSAVAEDGADSFAGQYDSLLDVAAEDVLTAYRQVLAGKYSAKAVSYRILRGYADAETAMAVLLLPMVPAQAAGVVATRERQGEICLADGPVVYAVSGLGAGLVDGRTTPEVWTFATAASGEPSTLRSRPTDSSILDEPLASRLAAIGGQLEGLFGGPQDVEWAVDAEGEISVLQSRPLACQPASTPSPEVLPEPADVLLRHGEGASWGVACGPIHVAATVLDAAEVPQGSVLALPTLVPNLIRVVGRVVAVVARSGSRASHFSMVAREFDLPVVIHPQAVEVLERLDPGRLVTVDADRGLVFAGCPQPGQQVRSRPSRPSGPVFRRLESILPYTAALRLTDPAAPEFAPAGVTSLHDVIRFCHEKGVAAMFDLVGRDGRGLRGARKLVSRLPISLYLLDVGGGLFDHAATAPTLSPDDLRSVPFWAFWAGLSNDDVAWPDGLIHADWQEMDRLAGGVFRADSRLLASYGVIGADYAHIMLRFGYHFSVVDSLCGENANANYITFRFKGGGGSFDQRRLRIGLLQDILEAYGFEVQTTGDLLDGWLSRESETVTQKRLAMLGYLLAVTRLMDMGLTPDAVEGLKAELLERMVGYEEGR